jgi:hypothetical protein
MIKIFYSKQTCLVTRIGRQAIILCFYLLLFSYGYSAGISPVAANTVAASFLTDNQTTFYGGIITLSSAVITSGGSVTINSSAGASGGSCGSGYTYQYQSSEDEQNWTIISGSSVSGITQTTYFRTQATCGTDSLTGKTVGGWTYHEVMVTSTTSVTISGSTYIDELRLYPSDAQMTTCTYEPLIGRTSQCSVDNKIQYYEYDGFGRLQDIKDPDGNIIKKIDYKYAGQSNN